MAVAASGVVSVPGASARSGSWNRRASGAAGQNTRATDGRSNMLRNTDTPSTMLDRILLSRVFQSWTYQRCTASTRSRISCAVVLSTRSRSYVIVWVLRYSNAAGSARVWKRVRSRRVRLKAETAKRGQVVACQLRRRDGDPRVGHIGRVGLRLLNLLGEQRLVDGAVVHVAQRHPSAGQHPVQLDDPADEIRVGLLPERFFALAEQLIQEGRDRVGERVRIEPCRTQGFHVSRPSRDSSM